MSDTKLVLGDVKFSGVEVPERIPFGGAQHLVVHELIGGVRVIDALGRSDRALEWSGWLLGENAVARAQELDAIRIGGLQQTVTWDKFNYTVIVREFEAEYQRFYQIPYRITCEVILDNTQPGSVTTTPIDQAINADTQLAVLQAQAIADQQLAAITLAIEVAVAAVQSFATEPRSSINAIAQTVLSAQSQTASLINATTAAIGEPSSFAGVVSGAGGDAATTLSTQTSQMLTLNNLNNISGVLGRIAANLSSANSSPNTISVSGGNLYQIAENQYGDPTAWTAIAKANDLTDPFIQGTQTLTIPTQSDESGGILSL